MYGGTEDALLQTTLLQLSEEKRGKHHVISKPIPMRTTSNRSKRQGQEERSASTMNKCRKMPSKEK